MSMIMLITIAIVGAILNYVFTRRFIRYARTSQLIDIPNKRSSHQTPTPRGGGVGFVSVTLFGYTAYLLFSDGLAIEAAHIVMLSCLFMAAGIGWLDDKHDLSNTTRFIVQSTIALLIVVSLSGIDSFVIPFIGTIHLGFAGTLLGIVWLVGVTNIFNFMDGIDGIAAGQAMVASLGWMVFGYILGAEEIMVLNILIFGTVAAFLAFNWSPAKIFMGDVGSVFLGFVFASMPFYVSHVAENIPVGISIWLGALLIWPFLFDGAFTLVRRALNGENILQAHRSHLYQRLNIAGWSHQEVSLLYVQAAFLCLILTFIFYFPGDLIRLLSITLLLALSFAFVVFVLKEEERSPNT